MAKHDIMSDIRALVDSFANTPTPTKDTTYKHLVTQKATLTEQLNVVNQQLAALEDLVPKDILLVIGNQPRKLSRTKSRKIKQKAPRRPIVSAEAVDTAIFDIVTKNPGISRRELVRCVTKQASVGDSTAYAAVVRLTKAEKLKSKVVKVDDKTSYLGYHKAA